MGRGILVEIQPDPLTLNQMLLKNAEGKYFDIIWNELDPFPYETPIKMRCCIRLIETKEEQNRTSDTFPAESLRDCERHNFIANESETFCWACHVEGTNVN